MLKLKLKNTLNFTIKSLNFIDMHYENYLRVKTSAVNFVVNLK